MYVTLPLTNTYKMAMAIKWRLYDSPVTQTIRKYTFLEVKPK
jgi:hypothetical protein